jgi:hypothetical protein
MEWETQYQNIIHIHINDEFLTRKLSSLKSKDSQVISYGNIFIS